MKRTLILVFCLSPTLMFADILPPSRASQAEVNTGTVANKYVSPATLSGWVGGGGTANQLQVSGTTNGLDGVYVPAPAFNIFLPSHYEPVWTNHAVGALLAWQNALGGSWQIIGGGVMYLNGAASNSTPPATGWSNLVSSLPGLTVTLAGTTAIGGLNGAYGGVGLTNGNITGNGAGVTNLQYQNVVGGWTRNGLTYTPGAAGDNSLSLYTNAVTGAWFRNDTNFNAFGNYSVTSSGTATYASFVGNGAGLAGVNADTAQKPSNSYDPGVIVPLLDINNFFTTSGGLPGLLVVTNGAFTSSGPDVSVANNTITIKTNGFGGGGGGGGGGTANYNTIWLGSATNIVLNGANGTTNWFILAPTNTTWLDVTNMGSRNFYIIEFDMGTKLQTIVASTNFLPSQNLSTLAISTTNITTYMALSWSNSATWTPLELISTDGGYLGH